MKFYLLTMLMILCSYDALADSAYTCTGHGIANFVEYQDYMPYIKINGIQYKLWGSGTDMGNHVYQATLISAYEALDGQHQLAITYIKDFKHPTLIANLDNIEAVNGQFTQSQIMSMSTLCKNNFSHSPVHQSKPKKKDSSTLTPVDTINNGDSNHVTQQPTNLALTKELNEKTDNEW